MSYVSSLQSTYESIFINQPIHQILYNYTFLFSNFPYTVA